MPLFEPRFGKTDFLNDMHMTYIYEYMKFIKTLDKTVGGDIRIRMEAISYEKYI